MLTLGTAIPKNIENPRMKRFLGELRSINCKDDNPTAVIIPKTTKNNPPIIGSGIVINIAPILPMTPQTTIIAPLYCTTLRLPTY